jgi:DNA polymerase-3 subunit beta
MKVVFTRDAAEPALNTVIRSMKRKTDIAILGDVLLAAYNDRLVISATDFDRRIDVAVAAEVVEAGEICIEGKTLANAIKRWPEGEKVKIETEDSGARCKVTCGRSRFRVGALPADDFPVLDLGPIDVAFALPGADLARHLGLCLPHVSDDTIRYYLTGVAVGENSQGELVFVATNGHTLARVAVDMPEDAGGLELRIIPEATVVELARIAGAVKGDDVEIEFSTSAVRVHAADTVYLSKLIDGEFPDYERIIPTDFAASLTTSAKGLAAAVDRAAVVLKGEATGIALEIGANVGGDILAVTAKLGDAEAESETDATYDGPPRRVGLNADYLRTILAPIGGAEAILSLQADNAGAVVVTSDALPRVTQVIMPVRLP